MKLTTRISKLISKPSSLLSFFVIGYINLLIGTVYLYLPLIILGMFIISLIVLISVKLTE